VVEQYVTEGGAQELSFDISDSVTVPSYHLMLNDVIKNNNKLDRHDKIENPRPDHRPLPVVYCYNVEGMEKVLKAIGPYWRLSTSSYPAKDDKMVDFMLSNGILKDEDSPDLIFGHYC
jgi:hypothetical protein